MPEVLQVGATAMSVGGGIGIGYFLIKFFFEWLAGRVDKNRETLDGGTQRLIENLEKRLDSVMRRLDWVEEELHNCQKLHAESEAERLRLLAVMQGTGDARQLAQLIVSSEKVK